MTDNVTQPKGRSLLGLLGGRPPHPMAQPIARPAPQPPAVDDLPAEVEPPADVGEYRAFITDRSNRRQMTLEVRYFEPRVGIEEGYLMALPQFVQAHFIGMDHVILHFTHAVFEIEGRGVRQVVELLKQGTLHTLQEWNAKRWPEPASDQPKITRIRAITPEMVLAEETGGGRRRAEERGAGR